MVPNDSNCSYDKQFNEEIDQCEKNCKENESKMNKSASNISACLVKVSDTPVKNK